MIETNQPDMFNTSRLLMTWIQASCGPMDYDWMGFTIYEFIVGLLYVVNKEVPTGEVNIKSAVIIHIPIYKQLLIQWIYWQMEEKKKERSKISM